MKSVYKFFWNFFAVFGICCMAGMIIMGVLVVKRYGGDGYRSLGTKILNKAGVDSLIVKKIVRHTAARKEHAAFPDPGNPGWIGHGARRDRDLTPVLYFRGEQPIPLNWYRMAQLSPVTIQKKKRQIRVSDSNTLVDAVKSAEPGDVITLDAGVYSIAGRRILVNRSGSSEYPICVRAETLGSVRLELDTVEGFFIDAPFWIFENLEIEGMARDHNRGEHAFHIVGNGKGFVMRNCRIHEFNAMIKANGTPGPDGGIQYPDHALIEDSSFYNKTARLTGHSVTFIDVVAGNGWIIRGNLICDFAKEGGNRISYGAFVKGNSHGAVFENNLVVGEYRTRGGTRVGLSLGGGGTGVKFARNKELPAEHTGGIIRNNVILHCNDVGIYLNKAANTKIYNNTLYGTMGIDVRFKSSSAVIKNNLISSRIKDRDNGESIRENNIISDFSHWFKGPERGDFTLLKTDKIVNKAEFLPEVFEAICSNPRTGIPDIGAFEYDLPACELIAVLP